jgi:hypothetical protein
MKFHTHKTTGKAIHSIFTFLETRRENKVYELLVGNILQIYVLFISSYMYFWFITFVARYFIFITYLKDLIAIYILHSLKIENFEKIVVK